MDHQSRGADDDRGRKLRQKRIGDQLRRLYDEYETFVQEISASIPVIRVGWEQFHDVERVADAITREVNRASYMREVTL